MTTTTPVQLKCPKKECGYKWVYKGKMKYNAICPDCRSPVRIDKNKV